MGHDKATRETSASAKSSLVKCAVLPPICGVLVRSSWTVVVKLLDDTRRVVADEDDVATSG